MMMLEDPSPQDYLITQEKLEEMKGNIPRAGPKYRLGMYFETIHNLPCFDNDMRHDEGGYTSYWETDTEVDSDLGNFIFNNVSGDSASLICIDDAVDIASIRERQMEAITRSKQSHTPHYKLEQTRSFPQYPAGTDSRSLECSMDSKHSGRSRHSHHSGSDGSYDQPPPVPPPRKTTAAATAGEFVDHTYETLDDCQDDYLTHQIYVSKGSDGSRGSAAKPPSTEDAESDHLSNKEEEYCGNMTPDRIACSGGGAKPRSHSLHLSKTRESSFVHKQRRKMSDPSTCRKRRMEKVGAKGSGCPAPVKGFPTGATEDYGGEYFSQPIGGYHSPDHNTSGSGSPVGQREGVAGSPDRRRTSGGQKLNPQLKKSGGAAPVAAQPLVIKHKGKTYFVPVVDQKLEKELEKRSKTNNPTVSVKKHHFNNSVTTRSTGVRGLSTLTSANHTHRLPASPPKVEPTDCASPNKRKGSSSYKSPPHANTKQVTHYGVL